MKKRIIGLPKTTATLAPNQSTISGGTSSLLPTDTATNKLATPKVPSSVANPASLTPWKQPKVFSDNMTKPILETPKVATPAPTPTKTPVATPATGEAIGQNADGSMIYANTPATPATPPPTTTPTAWVTTPTTPQYSESLYDPNNYLWSGKTKDQFMAMDVADQTNYINQGVQNVEERQAIMNQVKTYAENKAQQEYLAKQNAINTQQQTNQNNIAQVQASQRIQEAQTNLDNLKQNLGFLGTWGRPMKSATAIEWASRLLTQSEQTFQQLKQVEDEYKSLRQSGVEFNANQFEEQMRKLQKDLTDSVDASIIQAMQWFDAESALASIDSPKKLFELQQKYLDMVDTSVEWITNRQVNEMKNLQTRYADYAKQYAEDLKQEKEKQALFTKNKNTLNEAMSKAVGYYVDGNWTPLTTTDGKAIEYKEEADKPIIDWNTWKVAYFNTDANGNQVVEIKQLFTPEMKAPDVKKIGTDANGKDIYGTFNQQTGGYEPIPWMTAPIGWWNADATVIDTIKKWEWFRDKAYQDSTGTWTIGYWFTNVNWQPVKPWMTMDRWTADNLLWQEISKRQNFMNYITVPLSESQKAALSSFEFNLWSWIREKNAKPILDKINAGDLQGAGNLMKQYTTSKWQQLQGLVNRRNEEARLLLDKWQKTAEYKTDKDATKEITGLRKEFNALPEVKNYKQVVTSYKTIEEQAKKATPAGDLSMIFSYMKLLDPTSTVREWEFANAQNAASIPDQVKNAYNKAAQGTRLNDKQRQDFLNWAKVQLKSYEDLHNQALENYRSYITMWWNPSDIWEFGDVSGSSVKQATEKALQAWWQTQNTTGWWRRQG